MIKFYCLGPPHFPLEANCLFAMHVCSNSVFKLISSVISASWTALFALQIKRQFLAGSLASRAQFAIEDELDRDFSPVMASEMQRFSRQDASSGDNLTVLQNQVEEVKGVMTQNIEKVLERGEKLDDLMDKTTDLEASVSRICVHF